MFGLIMFISALCGFSYNNWRRKKDQVRELFEFAGHPTEKFQEAYALQQKAKFCGLKATLVEEVRAFQEWSYDLVIALHEQGFITQAQRISWLFKIRGDMDKTFTKLDQEVETSIWLSEIPVQSETILHEELRGELQRNQRMYQTLQKHLKALRYCAGGRFHSWALLT